MDEISPEFDRGWRLGTFDKCNGKEPRFHRDYAVDDTEVFAYFEAWDDNEVRIAA